MLCVQITSAFLKLHLFFAEIIFALRQNYMCFFKITFVFLQKLYLLQKFYICFGIKLHVLLDEIIFACL